MPLGMAGPLPTRKSGRAKPGGLGFLSSYGQTMAHIESLALGVNMAQFVGHGSIRSVVCEGQDQNRPLTARELDRNAAA